MSGQTIGKVAIGSQVRVTGLVPGIETVFHSVCENEVDWNNHKIPQKGPLWDFLGGAEVGSRTLVDLAGETVELEIREVGRD